MDSYKDITPRVGVAYDVFGTGKTVAQGQRSAGISRRRRTANTYGRCGRPRASLDDGDANVDRREQQLPGRLQPAEPEPAGQPRDRRQTSAAPQPSTFGTASQFTRRPTRRCCNGWGVRPGDWGFGVSVQQQVLPRVSVEVGYNRRWLDNFVDHRQPRLQGPATSARSASWRRRDPRLPGGGGQTIAGLYNVNQRNVGATSHRTTPVTRWRATTATSTRITTACCSTSARARATA